MALGKRQIAALEYLSNRASAVEVDLKQSTGITDSGIASLHAQGFVEYRVLGHADTGHAIVVYGITDDGKAALAEIKAPETEARNIRIRVDVIRKVQLLAALEHRRFGNMINVLLLEALAHRTHPAPQPVSGVGERGE